MNTARSGATPRQRARAVVLRDGRTVNVRPVAVSDAPEILQAFARLSADARYQRFMQHKKTLDLAVVDRGVHPRAGEEFALVATVPAADGYDIVGAARYVRAAERDSAVDDGGAHDACEFAITVADGWRGTGLATRLLASLIRRARRDGYRRIEGLVLAENAAMLAVARRLRFAIERVADEGSVVRVVRSLRVGSQANSEAPPPLPR